MGHLRTRHRRGRVSKRKGKDTNYRRSMVKSGINVFDLNKIPLRCIKGLLVSNIKYRLRMRDLPLVVITHNVVEKIMVLNEVVQSLDIKCVVTNENNLGRYTIYS